MKEGGRKLPLAKPDLLAELAAGLSRLKTRERQLWQLLAAAAMSTLKAQRADRQWRQQQQQQDEEHRTEQQQQQQLQSRQQQQLQGSDAARTAVAASGQAIEWDMQPLEGSLMGNDVGSEGVMGLAALQQIPRGSSSSRGSPVLAEPEPDGDDAPPVFDSASVATTYAQQRMFVRQQQQQQQQSGLQPASNDTARGRSWSHGAIIPVRGRGMGRGSVLSSTAAPHLAPPAAPKYSVMQPGHRVPYWLSADYPKFAAAAAAVGLQDVDVMQLLASEAASFLPLMSLQEVAVLAESLAAVNIACAEFWPALTARVHWQLAHWDMTSQARGSSSSRSSSSSSSWSTDVAAAVCATHAVKMMGHADCTLLAALQPVVLSAGSSSVVQNPDRDSQRQIPLPPEQLMQLLQLIAFCSNSSSSSSSVGPESRGSSKRQGARSKGPRQQQQQQQQQQHALISFTCNQLAACGLDELSPLQLQATALALGDLHERVPVASSSAASEAMQGAAAGVAAAALARAEECGAAVLTDVLWGVVSVGTNNMLLAEAAASAALTQHGWRQVNAPVSKAGYQGYSGFEQPQMLLLQQQQQQQQEPLMTPKHQANLVWSLRQLGRVDLAQQMLLLFLDQGT
jgi:hypothetical protein